PGISSLTRNLVSASSQDQSRSDVKPEPKQTNSQPRVAVAATCPDIVINGTLGGGAAGFAGVQSSGNQTGRLNRNGIASSCAAPKTCNIFDPTGSRAFDAYQIPNQSGQDACVSINLTEASNLTCNLQSNAYLDTYDPSNICTGYLGDPGLSTGVPPTPTNFS